MKIWFLFNILIFSAYGISCSSCDAVDNINEIQKSKQSIYINQTQNIIIIDKLNANYLLYTLGINFELDRQIRLINIQNQLELVLKGASE